MPHIHTEPGHHDLTASGFIVRTDLPEPKMFMNRHLLSGKWAQPGGHVELHESPWSAVQHEVTEESGYVMRQLKLLQPQTRVKDLGSDALLEPTPVCLMTYELNTHKGHFHTDISFSFVATGEPEQELAENESATTRFFTRGEIAALPQPEIPDNVRQIALFVFDECVPNWEKLSATSWTEAT